HVSAVVGIAANHVNRQTVTVAGTEVRFWSFLNGDLLDTATLPSDALFSRFNGDNDTLAVPLTDGSIVLFDTLRRRVFRRFENTASTFCVDLYTSAGAFTITDSIGLSYVRKLLLSNSPTVLANAHQEKR
ncbi:unnamed protein product, partial [Dicrocoelium dendriticum]